MKQHVYKVKSPGAESEDMIVEHVYDVHQRTVIIGNKRHCLELPYTFRENVLKMLYVSDPGVIQYLGVIVIYKTVEKGVEIYGKGDKGDDNRKKNSGL
jgi:hypothetical protein